MFRLLAPHRVIPHYGVAVARDRAAGGARAAAVADRVVTIDVTHGQTRTGQAR
jgi:hypothetical protein